MKFLKKQIKEDWDGLKKFENLSDSERSIVFYAENQASINHFKTLIDELTETLNLQICYVTSVKNDPILSSNNNNILSFYIGDGTARTKFFLTLKAKTLLMDMPDIGKYHIKRSKVYPVHYIYLFHSMFSTHSYLKKGALDNYDTIFCVGQHHVNEIKATEEFYGLKSKILVNYGFGRLDTLLKEKENFKKLNSNLKNLVLITPSYGKENILQKSGIELIDLLLKSNFTVLLRPHFRTLKDSKKLIDSVKEKFSDNPKFIFQDGIIPSEYFQNSMCMISDWSGISFEYAFTFEKPVIFIDVPKKELNPDSNDISFTPIEISFRNKVGHVVSPNNLKIIPGLINDIEQNNKFGEGIQKIRLQTVFNIGESAKTGADFIQKLIRYNK